MSKSYDGSFSYVDCYDDFSSAKSKMRENEDYVVRHSNSLSYTKIVAMNSGWVYAYPRTYSGDTLTIYEHYPDSSEYESTYVAIYDGMYYLDTDYINSTYYNYVCGWVKVNAIGFEGYVDLENVDLVPNKFIKNRIGIYLAGGSKRYSESAYNIVCGQNYFDVVDNNGIKELYFTYYEGKLKNGSTVSYRFLVGRAADSMNVGTIYYSYDGYTFYTSQDYTGDSIVYYNYYQFLPLRSKSSISADSLNNVVSYRDGSVMNGSGQYFIDAQEKYGVNALLLFSLACHESAYGTSWYAKNRNNLFGWNAVDDNPGNASSFTSVGSCVSEMAAYNIRMFLDSTNWRFFSSSLGNKGSGLNVQYASDPYWGLKIAGIAYSIDKNYNNSNDYNVYSLSLINTFDVPIKASPSDSSNTLYSSNYGPHYQQNFIVITLGTSGDFTKIQSTNPIDDNGNIKTHTTNKVRNDASYGEYDFDKSVAYIKSSYLTVVNKTNPTIIPSEENKEELVTQLYVDNISLLNNSLNISGFGLIKGLDFTDTSTITHKVLVKNITDSATYKEYIATTSAYDGIYYNDGHTYTYSGFNISIPLSDLQMGEYYFVLEITNGSTTMSTNLYSSLDEFDLLNTSYGEYNYKLKANSVYKYRFELSVESIPSSINYSLINKPTTRNSLASFLSFNLDENGTFSMRGCGMIYYLDYASAEATTYTLYIVDSASNYKEINCTTEKSSFDYKGGLGSRYENNADYIEFETGSVDISDLVSEYYTLILKIQNGNYIDFVEISNSASIQLPEVGNYRLFTSTIRDRVMLQVSK